MQKFDKNLNCNSFFDFSFQINYKNFDINLKSGKIFGFLFVDFCADVILCFHMSGYDLNGLNEEQKLALLETEGVVLVTAGAGSGKTRLLTHRICYLIQQLGVSPFNILAITFTNKATNEMKTRLENMGAKGVWISTFHSMCVRILRENIDRLDGFDKNFTIIDENDKNKIIKELLKKNGVDEDDKEKVSKHLENIKNKGLDIDEYFEALAEFARDKDLRVFQRVCHEYEERLKKSNALDFDDLLNKTLFLFHNFGDVLKKYAQRFQYILVDEFQDTNLVQYKLVKLLASVQTCLSSATRTSAYILGAGRIFTTSSISKTTFQT